MTVNTSDILSVACVIVLILAGLSIAATTESPVGVRVFQFRPGQLEVKAGTRVTWTNQDDITHTVTSGTPEQRDGRFDQRLEGRGRPRPWSSRRIAALPEIPSVSGVPNFDRWVRN